MINSDDILNDMKVQIDNYKKQYDEVSMEIEQTGREYQAKIDELQQERVRLLEEGNAKLDKLKMQREQIRGMHASLYAQYSKYAKPEDVTAVSEKQPAGEPVADVQPVAEKPKVPAKKKAEKQSQGLSDAEKETLAKIAGKDAETTDKVSPVKADARKNEIPEYLQDEYKK